MPSCLGNVGLELEQQMSRWLVVTSAMSISASHGPVTGSRVTAREGGVKSCLSRSRAETTRPRSSAVNGVQFCGAVTGTDEAVAPGFSGSRLVVAVIAVVACNGCNACNAVVACNARIARNARNAAGPRCVQRRNDVNRCHWSFGQKSFVIGLKYSSVIDSSLQVVMQ